jgi:hypothetical protein
VKIEVEEPRRGGDTAAALRYVADGRVKVKVVVAIG